ncbi:MICOS complex subunit MIC60-like [Mercenaria mercenaria]|uniref:MICOS complex subunit MIC60-like n=1 Tax=Mercenaria mercenaria TaxID=6596 RepID=UPI00234E9341|nr:MICOS complex subunit MIC60-like [Mercenaria mercenaria]
MWKATSKGVTSRIRIVNLTRNGQRCMVHQSQSSSSPTPPGNLKDVPPPGSMPPPVEPKPPGESSKGGGGVFGKLLGVTLVGIGGAIGYAWYDQEFRNTLKVKVPYSEGVMDAIFTYLPDSPSVPAPLISDKSTASMPQLSKEEARLQDEQLLPKLREKPEKIVVEPVTPAQPATPVPPPPPKPVEKKKEDTPNQKQLEEEVKARDAVNRKLREKEEARRRQAEKEAEIAAENAALEVILENLTEVCDGALRKAREAQEAIIESTKNHTQLLKTAMDDSSNVLDKETQWQSVSMAFEKREEAVNAGEQIVHKAKENLEKLRHAIDDGRQNSVTKKNKALTVAKEKLNQLTTELNKKQNEVSKVESESRVMSKYKTLVDRGKDQFKKELESLMPDVKIGTGRKLSEEELNTLIAHAHRRIEQLQKQLAEHLAMEQQRIQVALSEQRDEDELITQARVKQETQKMLDEFAVEKDKWEADAQVQFELELRRNLARQTAAHSEHLQEVLRLQEEKLTRAFEHELHLRILEDRKRFEGELTGWIARLRGIEAAVTARAETEMVAKEAQELWLACVALNGAIRVGNESGSTWEEQLKPLEKEVDTVFFAAKNNPFVCLVLDSIPETALKRGVYTEDNLKERFYKVSRVARRVALIDETGGSLAKFFLSYIQSVFVFSTVYAKEVNDSVDLEDLDTFQICSHARYWLERNDIEQALKFMNLLTGESRRVAADWIEEARLLLETRQATYALMAFASSTGLGTLF